MTVSPQLGEHVTAYHKPHRRIDRVFIHCSASSNPKTDAKAVDEWHKKRGWAGIGYHYFVKTDGVIEQGRDLEITPAAQAGHNVATIAICLNGLREADFTEAQFNSLRWLCRAIRDVHNKEVTFHGHREVTSAKTCPVFDYRRVLNLDSKGRMLDWDTAPAPPAELQPSVETLLTSLTLELATLGIEVNPRHRQVKMLQALLTAYSPRPPGDLDGVFGRAVEDSVRAFQRAYYLAEDGVTGPVTWEALLRDGA